MGDEIPDSEYTDVCQACRERNLPRRVLCASCGCYLHRPELNDPPAGEGERVPVNVAPEVRARLRIWLQRPAGRRGRGYSDFLRDALDREEAEAPLEHTNVTALELRCGEATLAAWDRLQLDFDVHFGGEANAWQWGHEAGYLAGYAAALRRRAYR